MITPMPDTRLDRLDRLAYQMDSLFRVPGTEIRIGLDSLLGLIPGVGDVAAVLPAGYIILQARQMGASRWVLARMAANTGIDTLIGSIPLVGDIFDIGNKANRKNVALLRRHLETKKGAASDALSDVPVKAA